ncbi:MAG TPA: VOC family protein [Thermoleophilaceae bacterium]|nr:VOC family protein [Thermoleophilaceae bacterium]
MPEQIRPTSLDHVALWVDQRRELAAFFCDHLGMHVIEETDTFTLVGVDAKLGKITLFDAEGSRERGTLERIGLRVGNLAAAVSGLPQSAGVRREDGCAVLEAPNGVPIVLVERGGTDFDLDHVVLRLPDREGALARLEEMGFERRDGALWVADRELRIVEGETEDGSRPLLNHIALLVDSAGDVQREAERRGVEVDDVKDAPNTFAVFLRGPAGVRVEYVEHKPGFALV